MKIKKIIIALMLALTSTTFFAQSAFDKFDGQDDVTSVIVNKKMFQLIYNLKKEDKDKEMQQYVNLISKLENLKVFTTESNRAGNEMKTFADKYIKTANLDELMRVNDNGKNIKIMVKSGGNSNQIKELLMFIEGSGKNNQTVLMSLTGDFDLDELSVLTDKMKLPGGDALKKASKK
jgi:hypothetical protein